MATGCPQVSSSNVFTRFPGTHPVLLRPDAVNNSQHWHTPIQIVLFYYVKPILFIPHQFRDKLRQCTTLHTRLYYSILTPPTHAYNLCPHKYHIPYKAFTYKN